MTKTRRSFFSWTRNLMAAGGVSGLSPAAEAAVPATDYYAKLGVTKIINAAGTYTALTASTMPPQVRAAVEAAARSPVRLAELQQKSGEYIAGRLKCEAAMVTGAFKVRKLAYNGIASAVLDVAAAPTVSDVVEAEGGSARVVPGGVKERALWSADWTCGLEVATTSGEGLSARATKDSRFTRGADCDGIAAPGSGGQLLCFASGPCAFTDEAHLAMLRVK